uniref:Uncharacterized protein n=1 Tax=Tanacetum cinerariifolium TaxID=118510 RepID=A0A6L2K8W8_TANCI|nr:hypothetical protein [Tanacetum cinerariifolium]
MYAFFTHFRIPKESLDEGFLPLISEEDMIRFGVCSRFKEVNVYWDIKTKDFIDAIKDYYYCRSSWKRLSGGVVLFEVVAEEIVAKETIDGNDVEQVVLDDVISHEVYVGMIAQEMLEDQTRAIKRRRVMIDKEDKDNAE